MGNLICCWWFMLLHFKFSTLIIENVFPCCSCLSLDPGHEVWCLDPLTGNTGPKWRSMTLSLPGLTSPRPSLPRCEMSRYTRLLNRNVTFHRLSWISVLLNLDGLFTRPWKQRFWWRSYHIIAGYCWLTSIGWSCCHCSGRFVFLFSDKSIIGCSLFEVNTEAVLAVEQFESSVSLCKIPISFRYCITWCMMRCPQGFLYNVTGLTDCQANYNLRQANIFFF